METTTLDPAVQRIRDIWAAKRAAGWTLERLGLEMGYPETSARQAAAQFLRGADPRLSSLRRFAGAVGVKIGWLVRQG